MRSLFGRTTILIAALVVLCAGGAQAQQDDAGARVEAAQHAHEAAAAGLDMGTATVDEVYRWSRRWLESVKAQDVSRADDAAGEHLARMETLQVKVGGLVASGMMPTSATAACTYYVAEARFWISKAGG